jgi:hypothetical protein
VPSLDHRPLAADSLPGAVFVDCVLELLLTDLVASDATLQDIRSFFQPPNAILYRAPRRIPDLIDTYAASTAAMIAVLFGRRTTT